MKTKATTIRTQTTKANAEGPRCHCGVSLACWLCLGVGKLRASASRKISEGDPCYGCGGIGTKPCQPCLDKLTRKAAQDTTAARLAIKLTA